MTQEEKAKAYDEAIKQIKECTPDENGFITIYPQEIFPELKKTGDERIRKNLIGYIKGISKNEVCEETKNSWVAWLEKQGKIVDYYEDRLDECACKYFNKGYKQALEKQGEQKSDDKVEPKFKVGDKIQYLKGCGTIMTIEKIENGEYIFANNLGHTTIEDGNKWYLVEHKPTWSEEDETMITDLSVIVHTYFSEISGIPFKYDLSEDKIRTWLKSLKNRVGCEANFTTTKEWSEEDEDIFKHLLDEIVCLGNNRNSANRLYYDRLIKFIKELKNRAQPKEKWCDKDERMLDRLIAYFEKQVAFTEDDNPRYANWLKSLRPHKQWKPSDEQMNAFDAVLVYNPPCSDKCRSNLITLFEQLKKLREE